MSRLLVQSLSTGRFLCPSLDGDEPSWVASLREAGGGVVADVDAARQLVADHCDPEDQPVLVDLDRLGTADDYAPQATDSSPRSGVLAGAEGAPDGNHGENI